MTKFILGGAQLGANYGAFSRPLNEKARRAESHETIRLADALGVTAVDTARSYPSSEELLGEYPWQGEIHTKLAGKLDPLKSLELSLVALRRDSIDLVYLFHQASTWSKNNRKRTEAELQRLRKYSRKIGISIYSVEDVKKFHSLDLIDVIQIPYNVASRIDLAELQLWRKDGKLVFARSVFLQGLLLDFTDAVVAPELQNFLNAFRQLCKNLGRSPQDLAIGWVLYTGMFDGIVIGAESPNQLRETYWSYSSTQLTKEEFEALESIPKPDSALIDPRAWKIGRS